MTSRNRTLSGVAAAAVGASVVVLAMVGVEIGASASTGEPKSPSCVQAIQKWNDAKTSEGTAKTKRDTEKGQYDAAVKARNDAQSAAVDPKSPPWSADHPDRDGTKVTNAEQNEIDQRQRTVDIEKGQYQAAQRDYEKARGKTANAKAAADEACKGGQGTPGTPGQDGKDGQQGPAGPAGAPGKDGEVIVQQVPVQSAPVVIREAPVPQTVTGGPVVTH